MANEAARQLNRAKNLVDNENLAWIDNAVEVIEKAKTFPVPRSTPEEFGAACDEIIADINGLKTKKEAIANRLGILSQMVSGPIH